MADNNNVIKYRRFHVNIGMIIFLFIIIYVLFYIFSYFTTETVSEYEVTQGTITTNHIYKALAVRSERVVEAPFSGELIYYKYDNSKTGVNDFICSIDSVGTITNQIKESVESNSNVSSDNSIVSSTIEHYLNNYDLNYFQNIVSTRNDIASKVSQSLNQTAIANLDKSLLTENDSFFHMIKSDIPGVVCYSTDGLEDLSLETYSAEHFLNMNSYKRTSLSDNSTVKEKEPLYKIIDDENWSLIIEISKDLSSSFAEKQVQKIKFCKDNYTTYANCSLDYKEGQCFLILSLNKGMIRYAADRYLDIELVISEKTGLKIPNSAIVEKNFYTIPNEYFIKGNDSNEEGVLIQRVDKNQKEYTEFITPTIYYRNDYFSYIDNEIVDNNDILIKPESTEKYTIGDDVGSLIGVYNINKGYAIFKQIKILSQNEDYSIVEMKTAYGISLYDHIALEGNKIRENQTIKK